MYRHLNQTQLTADGNFHANRYTKNSDPNNISLFDGRAYYGRTSDFTDYLARVPEKALTEVCACVLEFLT